MYFLSSFLYYFICIAIDSVVNAMLKASGLKEYVARVKNGWTHKMETAIPAVRAPYSPFISYIITVIAITDSKADNQLTNLPLNVSKSN